MNDITQGLQEIKNELAQIRSHAEAQTGMMANTSMYALGYAISLGMNLALDNGLIVSALTAFLSWINVGYVLVKHMGH